jgi:hypothetical protein
MSEFAPSAESNPSDESPWYAGFDVVDIETTPWDEVPEEDGFHLICPIDGCECEEEFNHLGEIRESEWTQLSRKDQILTDGTTLKEAYCPAHSLEESESSDSEPSGIAAKIRAGLGTPSDEHEFAPNPTPAPENPEYARYDFAEGGVSLNGFLVTCGCDSCLRDEEFEDLDRADEDGWVSGMMVDILANGRMLFEGRCPEHRETE